MVRAIKTAIVAVLLAALIGCMNQSPQDQAAAPAGGGQAAGPVNLYPLSAPQAVPGSGAQTYPAGGGDPYAGTYADPGVAGVPGPGPVYTDPAYAGAGDPGQGGAYKPSPYNALFAAYGNGTRTYVPPPTRVAPPTIVGPLPPNAESSGTTYVYNVPTYSVPDPVFNVPSTTYVSPAAPATSYSSTTYSTTTYSTTTYPTTTSTVTTYPATSSTVTTYPSTSPIVTTYPTTSSVVTTYPATTSPVVTTYPETSSTTYSTTTYPDATYSSTTTTTTYAPPAPVVAGSTPGAVTGPYPVVARAMKAAETGFQLVPAPDVPPSDRPNDAAPSQWFEIIRPGNGPIRIGRVSSSCVCVSPRVPERNVAAGQRALVEARIVSRPPRDNLTYVLFVNVVEPTNVALDADVTIKLR